MNFIERVRSLMKEKNMSQKELAEKAGITEASMSKYLSGERTPRVDVIVNLANALETTTDYLLGKDVILTSNEEEFQTVTNHFIQDIEDEMLNELISLYSSISNEKKKDLLQLVKSLTNLSK